MIKDMRYLAAFGIGLIMAGCAPVPKASPPEATAIPPALQKPPPPRPGQTHATTVSPAPDIGELAGQDEAGLRQLLGSPGAERNQGAARVLSYRSGTCSLEVVLFPDAATGESRVLTYDMPRDGCYPVLRRNK